MAEATRDWITTVEVWGNGSASVHFYSGRSEMIPAANVLLPDKAPPSTPMLERLVSWLRANPLKTQAALALLAGAVPETLRQLLVILL